MKTNRLLAVLAAALVAVSTAQANYFDEIKGNLTAPVAESPKFTALYFSAHWCPPCRLFTPKLVAWYNEFKKSHPNFELVFVSSDRDQAAMDKYIQEANMPWPAVKFDSADAEIFRKFSSTGIPYLVLIDENGKDLTGKPGNEWQSPSEVLTKIETIVGGN